MNVSRDTFGHDRNHFTPSIGMATSQSSEDSCSTDFDSDTDEEALPDELSEYIYGY